MSTNKLTVVPIKRRVISQEWFLVIFALLAAGIVWAFNGINTSATQVSMPATVITGESPIREMEVTFLDVGEGDGAFIRTPNGHTILLDAGPGSNEYSRFDAGKEVVIPFLQKKGIKKIDTMLMSHPHADHYGGMMAVLDAFEVGEFLDPGLAFGSFGYEKLLNKIEAKKIPFKLVHAPKILSWDPSIFVQVLWPEPGPGLPGDPNNNSIVIRLVYGNVVYLLSGDMEKEVEEKLYAYGSQLRTTVLKVPHHGSHTSSTKRLLKLLQPQLAVFSLGYRNRFGHPDHEIVQRYEDMGIKILRTDQSGTVKTFCDSHKVRVIPEKSSNFTIYPFPQAKLETAQ